MNIGERIKKLRTQKCISQTELAEKINVSKQTLYKYETGIVTNIPSDKVEALANALNTTPAYLMGWEGTPINEKDNSEDDDIRRIERAHKRMSEKERERFMEIIKASFDEYFSDDYDEKK